MTALETTFAEYLRVLKRAGVLMLEISRQRSPSRAEGPGHIGE